MRFSHNTIAVNGALLHVVEAGLRDAGVVDIQKTLIPAAGHFTQEEAPAEVRQALARFIGV